MAVPPCFQNPLTESTVGFLKERCSVSDELKLLVAHPAIQPAPSSAVIEANIKACEEHAYVKAGFEAFRASYEALIGGDASKMMEAGFYQMACTFGEQAWSKFFTAPKKVSVAKSSEPDPWQNVVGKAMAYYLEQAWLANIKAVLADIKSGKLKSVGFPEDLDLNADARALFAAWQGARGNPSTTFGVRAEYAPEGYEALEIPSADPADKGALKSVQWGCYSNSHRNVSGGKVKAKKVKAPAEKAEAPAEEAEAPELEE